jgi:hypothetical protein
VITSDSTVADTLNIAYLAHELSGQDGFLEVLDNSGLAFGKDERFYLLPDVSIRKSGDDRFRVTRTISSHGKSLSDVRTHLEKVNLSVILEKDSLKINPFYRIPEKDCWQLEKIGIAIEVPEGKFVRIGPGRWTIPGYFRNEHLSYRFFQPENLDTGRILKMAGEGLEGIDIPD